MINKAIKSSDSFTLLYNQATYDNSWRITLIPKRRTFDSEKKY